MKKNKFNPVAKHLRTFNKAQVMIDRKKEAKKTGSHLNNRRTMNTNLTLRDLTKQHHDSVERSEFAELLLGGCISPSMYHVYLSAQYSNYKALEDLVELPDSLLSIFRSEFIQKDLLELEEEYRLEELSDEQQLVSVTEYIEYLKTISSEKDGQRKLLAHVYVRHFGDLHGGQIIKKRVPGSGSMYEFNDRKELIAGVRSLLDNDMAEEAKTCFEYAEYMFSEIADKYDFETFGLEDDEDEDDEFADDYDSNDYR